MIKMIKKLNGKRIFMFIILLFAIWNLCWFLLTTIKYNRFTENIPKNEWGLYFITKEDGYMYSVKKPDYLRLTGNLGVVNNNKGEALIIWPLISGEFQYGIRLQKDGVAREFYVDKNMKPIENDMMILETVEEYEAELNELFSRAHEMWQLD